MAQVSVEHPNATLFRRGYEAFNSGDMDAVRETFDQNIVWHTGGRSRFSRDSHGIDDTLGFFMELIQATNGTFHTEVHDIIANDDHAVALVSSSAEVNGRKIESRAAHVVHVKDGKVTESWFFDEDPYQFDEVFPA
ncbi:MAG: nuclear transport factor 2 family protein [Candidatus Dormibacteraeota bacterium]|nr:nuclear transport factor 2 family protein [Candidatus Dormibacteraeota bacterium]MBV9525367.1 nuclear transport factor 2 family protein [Candidatus Dormibacteraeota bacterium]